LPTAQVIAALQAHQVIGVDTKDIKTVSVTRLSRTLEGKEIELAVAHTLEHRSGLGAAANLSLTFDRDVGDIRLEAANTGALQPISVRFEPRNGRFDVSFEVANENNTAPAKLRFTGMQMRRQLRAGQAIKVADLAKPDLVQRDDNVTLIYESVGLYLTVRGKAVDGGTEGDVVNVVNLQSKRTVSGVIIGRGQVAISVATPRLPAAADASSTTGSAESAAPVSVANSNNVQVSPKAE
jgi:flagella basal body P-ring formation protein FlgA